MGERSCNERGFGEYRQMLLHMEKRKRRKDGGLARAYFFPPMSRGRLWRFCPPADPLSCMHCLLCALAVVNNVSTVQRAAQTQQRLELTGNPRWLCAR